MGEGWAQAGSAARRCDNITISPALLGELDASHDPLPRKLWPSMGGQGQPRVDMHEPNYDTFKKMHNEVHPAGCCRSWLGATHAVPQCSPAEAPGPMCDRAPGLRACVTLRQALKLAWSASRRPACRLSAPAGLTTACGDTSAAVQDQMAVDKLKEGINSFASDAEKLEAMIGKLKG